jgi:uncharacterized repeat protein (TIGR03803 family)
MASETGSTATELGGRYNEGCCGTLFSVTAQGVETVLHSFGGPGDGSQPEGGVTLVGDTLYGLTGAGGAYNQGVAWTWSPSGGYKVLHSFSGPDGSGPLGGLIFADGDLYGTTFAGGANGYGVVFKMTPAGLVKVLYAFKGGTGDGRDPVGDLAWIGGRLYGTTTYDGAGGFGTVFEVTRAGVETTVHAFAGGGDGAYPRAGVIALDGVLYGTTGSGGGAAVCVGGCGTVFRLTRRGAETILHAFSSKPDGAEPFGGLTNVGAMLYGATAFGGARGNGAVFAVTRRGHERIVHAFRNVGDGDFPAGSLAVDTSGTLLYGATSQGGLGKNADTYGLVFSISLSP